MAGTIKEIAEKAGVSRGTVEQKRNRPHLRLPIFRSTLLQTRRSSP